ncbi:laminin subunit alpha-4 [Clupea harengus]|uniref:Laminin subunit alpha-4 n=1 Tax=Clupea harengus TaxID=7950 RepID=A0A6P3VPN3_CLUHA|nr:laminin subunit alpha-4 [Clupea harengus]
MAVRRTLPVLCLLSILSGSVRHVFSDQPNTVVKVCARGLFLSERGECLRCNCRGHADSCEDITGICISCKDNSTGNFCESCQDGFTPEITPDRRHLCRPCACPLPIPSNNFAEYCDQRGSVVRCVCQPGYAGHSCERCAPGYYGNPMRKGDSCQKCDCNGNSDPNLIFNECNNVTGQCLNCWGNTAGANCERCAPGFYGDAVSAKNCRECQCDKCGTASCDDRTGVCHCRPGVTGRLCDQCEEGYSGFSSCLGCRRCECAAAALKTTCHPLTHSCKCRPGAGGRYCERCLPGHWDYSPSGCKTCDCTSGHCDMHTGECLPEASQVSECNIDCDECIWHLIGDIRQSNKTLDQLKVSVLNISSGAAANDRIKYYNYTAQRLQAQLVGWRNKSALMRSQTDELEEATTDLIADALIFSEKGSSVMALGERVEEATQSSFILADELTTNLTALNVLIEGMISDWEQYREQQEVDPETAKQNTAHAERMVSRMRTVDLSTREPIATDEATEAHELLRRVRQLEKRLISTEGRVSPVREVVSRFSSRLSQAGELLVKAQTTNTQTKQRHEANILKLQRNKAQQHRLMENNEAVNDTLSMAADIISDTELGLADLETMVKNVSQHHAAIDGASKLLIDKTESLSLADRELVQKATEYAEDLEKQAEQLERNLKGSDVNGIVQKAIDASNVHDNIIKYVDDANITGLTTLDLATRAEDAIEGIGTQLDFLKTQSDLYFRDSVSLRSEEYEVRNLVRDTLTYIEETNETLTDSNKKLVVILNDLSALQKDRTSTRLEFSQEVAEGTLNRSAEVLQTISPISQKVQEWSNNLNNNEYSTEAFDRAVVSAGEAVDNLSEIVPKLLDKLRVVEEKKPVNNVSTNILKIRELIAQARSVAKKVQISMKFNGQSSVEVQPHPNVEELKAVTTISLFMRVDPDKDPIEDRFILYLGDKNGQKDYMGLAIKNDNLVYVYNLGGEDVEIPLSSKPVSSWPPVFNLIRMERLGRHGKIFLTVPSQSTTAEQKFIQKGVADGPDSLFDLDPADTVFFVGGVPPSVKLPPPLSLAPFVGCLELASLNNDVISLYNFKELHKMDVVASQPCARNKLAFSQSRVASYLFDGTGYALVSNIERRGRIGVVTRFDVEVRTVANDGILLLMVNGSNYFLLGLKDGYLQLKYDFNFAGGPIVMDSKLPKLQINDARNHEVSVIYHHSKKIILLVDRSHVKSIENEKKALPFSHIHIGGAPSSILNSRSELSSLLGLRGCVRGFQFQKKDFNLLEEPGTIGISSGCPEESFMSRQAYFSGEGYLGSTAKITPFEAFEGGFNFRTQQSAGLLFYHNDGTDEFSISLENGGVVMNSKGTKVKSHKKNYNDGRQHFLVASVTNKKYELVVDDKDKQEKKHSPSSASSSAATEKLFYFGGSPASKTVNFTGCISYAYLTRHDRDIEAEDFQKYSDKVQTSLQDCPMEKPPAALHQKPDKNSPKPKQGPSRKVGRDKSSLPQGLLGLKSEPLEAPETESAPCFLSQKPRATRNANHYGGTANSRQEYNISESINERSHFSLSVKTQSNFGLIFYVSDETEDNFMALFMAQGKLMYTFNIGQDKVRIKTQEKYNDGAWHNVIFIRDGNTGRLIVDGLTVIDDRVTGTNASWHVSRSVYVGGVPPGKAQTNIQRNSANSFTGCVRNLQLNGRRLSSASRSFGVLPCFEGPSEPGAYFSEEGGYVVLDDSFSLGLKFELVVEVRPRVATGVLLHAYTSKEEYLTVYVHNNQVVVLVNNGIREFSTVVTPMLGMCDGNWHRITVIRDASVVQLDVDSEANHVVGPLNSGAHISRTPVFVGGAPASLLPPSVAARRSYTGCIRNLTVNETPVSFRKAALVSGAVGVDSCPAA